MRLARLLAALFVFGAVLAAPALASGLALDALVPTLPASPATVAPASGDSVAYRVILGQGETLQLSLSPAGGSPATLDLDLYLYGPSATAVDHASAIRKAVLPPTGYPEVIGYQAPAAGTYYLEVYCAEGTGQGVLTWSVLPEPLLPVYRFYNIRTGTHFYTPNEDERANVEATLGGTYRLEGAAYYMRASKNSQYLYRFFNRRNGSHFYTASDTERDSVITTLGGTYNYDGPTYLVSTSPGEGRAAVYRFYNRRTGSHFYTATASERDTVIRELGGTYDYEGPAFYIGQ